MPKFFYGNDNQNLPYGGLSDVEDDVTPIESTVASWLLTHRARYDQWPAHFAVREHLDSKEQKALGAIIYRKWVTMECKDGIVRYVIPEAEHTNARRRRMAGATWGRIAEALEPEPPRFLSGHARRLLIYLIENRDETNSVHQSISALSSSARMNTKAARRALLELQEWGMVTSERVSNRKIRYGLAEDRLKEYTGVKA